MFEQKRKGGGQIWMAVMSYCFYGSYYIL